MKKKIVLLLILVLSIFCIAATGCVTNQVDETVVLTEENASLVFSKVAEQVHGSTVSITCNVNGNTAGGAGVVVSTDGYILTNYHVVKGARDNKVWVHFTDKENPNSTRSYSATIVAEKKDRTDYAKMDLALVKLDSFSASTLDLVPVKIKSEKVKWGEYGIVIGFPKQLGSLVSHAMVSNPSRKILHQIEDTLNTTKEVNLKTEFITLDAPVNPGNSGGGFFDSNGKLAGIVTLRQYGDGTANKDVVFGIGYAIPASSISGYLERYGIRLSAE